MEETKKKGRVAIATQTAYHPDTPPIVDDIYHIGGTSTILDVRLIRLNPGAKAGAALKREYY